jgi:hypothetical protein
MPLLYTDIYEQFGRERVTKLAFDRDYSETAITSGTLTKDKRYCFIAAGSGAVFTNVGLTATVAIGVSFYSTKTAAPTTWGGASVYVGMSSADIVENEIENCRNTFESIANYCDVTFAEDDEQVSLAMKYYTMYLLYVRSQNEAQGVAERATAIYVLVGEWGDSVKAYFDGLPKNNITASPESEKIADVANIDYETDDMEDWL